MTEEEPTDAHKLWRKQEARETREHKLLEESRLTDEADQHERRRDKAAYLKKKLAEREQAEGADDG